MSSRQLVDVDSLASRLDDANLSVLELDVSRTAYDAGHIPGAVLWNAYTDLRDERYRTIGTSDLARLMARSGVTPLRPVVVYGYAAPLGFWLLEANGFRHIAMLEGPREVWAASGREWSVEVPEPHDGEDPALHRNDAVVASRASVEAAMEDPSTVLLDVRAPAEYGGLQFWPSGATADVGRAGHVPGAVNVPIEVFRETESEDELKRLLDEVGVTRDKPVITYCTIGNRASEAWFTLRYRLGYDDVRVYYDSWVDWGNAPDTPIEP